MDVGYECFGFVPELHNKVFVFADFSHATNMIRSIHGFGSFLYNENKFSMTSLHTLPNGIGFHLLTYFP